MRMIPRTATALALLDPDFNTSGNSGGGGGGGGAFASAGVGVPVVAAHPGALLDEDLHSGTFAFADVGVPTKPAHPGALLDGSGLNDIHASGLLHSASQTTRPSRGAWLHQVPHLVDVIAVHIARHHALVEEVDWKIPVRPLASAILACDDAEVIVSVIVMTCNEGRPVVQALAIAR